MILEMDAWSEKKKEFEIDKMDFSKKLKEIS